MPITGLNMLAQGNFVRLERIHDHFRICPAITNSCLGLRAPAADVGAEIMQIRCTSKEEGVRDRTGQPTGLATTKRVCPRLVAGMAGSVDAVSGRRLHTIGWVALGRVAGPLHVDHGWDVWHPSPCVTQPENQPVKEPVL
jgi:hypothetical protein